MTSSFRKYKTWGKSAVRHTNYEWELGSFYTWREKYISWQRYYGVKVPIIDMRGK